MAETDLQHLKLEEAKLRYPIGTIFKSAQSGKIGTVNGIPESQGSNIHVSIVGNILYVYWYGNWAEIISIPEPQIINHYQIY